MDSTTTSPLQSGSDLDTERANEAFATDVIAVGRLDAVPTILQVLCEVTGMGFAAIARVTQERWIACAVEDNIGFGLKPGGELDVETTLCIESRAVRAPIVIDYASQDERYCDHHTPKLYHIESYVSVPIVMANGDYFGNLCAIDPRPAKVSDPRIVSMFSRFARLIASQLEAELRGARDRIALRDERAANELRDQFIAILGHDLRNPLSAIDTTSQLMKRAVKDPMLLELAKRISVNAHRMSALIDDVLDFARGRLGGGIPVTIRRVTNLDESLNSVIHELQDSHPDRPIQSDINLHCAVDCDVGRVQQVASNLIGNALTHGAPEFAVKVAAMVRDENLILEVWNAGEPIPQESMEKIFRPFWRHSTSESRQGLGLGLHICSQIIHAHGGTLSVTSSAQGGTKFVAALPLRSSISH